MQVAFTASGLLALGVREEVVAGFSPEWVAGMAGDESRSRRLGDIDANAPGRWDWGGPGSEPHVLIMLFAQPNLLEGWRAEVQSGPFGAAFDTMACLPTDDLQTSSPSVSEMESASRRSIGRGGASRGSDEIAYTNVVALGEFLLGYPNEYGKYTDRPLLDPSSRGRTSSCPG